MPPDFPGSPGRLTTSMVNPLEPQISDSGTDHRNDDHEVFSRSLPSGLNCSRTPWSGAKACATCADASRQITLVICNCGQYVATERPHDRKDYEIAEVT